MTNDNPDRGVFHPFLAGSPLRVTPPLPEPRGGVVAVPPNAAPDAALLDAPTQNREALARRSRYGFGTALGYRYWGCVGRPNWD